MMMVASGYADTSQLRAAGIVDPEGVRSQSGGFAPAASAAPVAPPRSRSAADVADLVIRTLGGVPVATGSPAVDAAVDDFARDLRAAGLDPRSSKAWHTVRGYVARVVAASPPAAAASLGFVLDAAESEFVAYMTREVRNG